MTREERRKESYLSYDVADDADFDDSLDLYDEDYVENSLEEDTLTAEEEGFMIGYMGT